MFVFNFNLFSPSLTDFGLWISNVWMIYFIRFFAILCAYVLRLPDVKNPNFNNDQFCHSLLIPNFEIIHLLRISWQIYRLVIITEKIWLRIIFLWLDWSCDNLNKILVKNIWLCITFLELHRGLIFVQLMIWIRYKNN